MTKYTVEKCEEGFVVYNPACKSVKRKFETKEEAFVYRDYLIERDRIAVRSYRNAFLMIHKSRNAIALLKEN